MSYAVFRKMRVKPTGERKAVYATHRNSLTNHKENRANLHAEFWINIYQAEMLKPRGQTGLEAKILASASSS